MYCVYALYVGRFQQAAPKVANDRCWTSQFLNKTILHQSLIFMADVLPKYGLILHR
jgi:hypothetical protein